MRTNCRNRQPRCSPSKLAADQVPSIVAGMDRLAGLPVQQPVTLGKSVTACPIWLNAEGEPARHVL
jgi:hypothetical protein